MRYAVLAITLVLGSASYGHAETELNKFMKTLPAKSHIGFIQYRSCFLQVLSEQRKTFAFDQVEISIVNQCKKHLRTADIDLSKAGLSSKERAAAIEEYAYLALIERQLLYDNKEIPGVEMDLWTARIMGCVNAVRLSEVDTCFVERGKVLIQVSDEPAETIATAVDGACQAPQLKLINQMAACVDVDRARQMVAAKTKLLRDAIVSAVVQARARKIYEAK